MNPGQPHKRPSPASWWKRLGPLQKWLTSILVAALATTLTGALVALFNAAGQKAVQRVTVQAHASPSPSSTPSVAVQPLAVAAQLHDPDNVCEDGRGWVYPPSLTALGPPDDTTPAANTRWALQRGAVPASGNYVVLTVQGRLADVVVLNALRIEIVKQTPPVAGDYGGRFSGGCGGFQPRQFVADLDSTPVKVVPVPGVDDQTGAAVPAVNFPYKVSNTDPEQFYLRVYTGQCACDWVIDIDWVFEGTSGTTRITDHGAPFRTTATTSSRGYLFDYSTKTWKADSGCYGCLEGRPYKGPLERRPP